MQDYGLTLWNKRKAVRPVPGMKLWLDASDTSTITAAAGLVSQWNDKSGNGNHATQGTGASQPTTGANTKNSKNVIDLDGTGDNLILPAGVYSIPNGPNTTFIVAKLGAESGAIKCLVEMKGADYEYYILYNPTPGQIDFRNDSAAMGSVASSSNTNTNFNIITNTHNGTALAINVNNANAGSASTGSNASDINEALIGTIAGVYLDGSIGEMIIYDRLLSTSEITHVQYYLSNKWGIAIS